jgi:simple sugar transport system ATP-binding protein
MSDTTAAAMPATGAPTLSTSTAPGKEAAAADAAPVEPEVLLELRGVRKTYGQNEALKGVSFKAYRGEILALLGDNGAGKSTLVKTMSGVVIPDSGSEILWEDRPVNFQSRHDAANLGVETIFQDNALVDSMSVARNIFMGREMKNRFGLIRLTEMRRIAASIINSITGVKGIDSPDKLVGSLSGGQKQAVAIARAVHFNRTLLILDEPTSALAVRATEALFTYLRTLKAQDITSILVTHDLFDAYRVCDRFVVIARGQKVFEARRDETTVEELIEKVSHG